MWGRQGDLVRSVHRMLSAVLFLFRRDDVQRSVAIFVIRPVNRAVGGHDGGGSRTASDRNAEKSAGRSVVLRETALCRIHDALRIGVESVGLRNLFGHPDDRRGSTSGRVRADPIVWLRMIRDVQPLLSGNVADAVEGSGQCARVGRDVPEPGTSHDREHRRRDDGKLKAHAAYLY